MMSLSLVLGAAMAAAAVAGGSSQAQEPAPALALALAAAVGGGGGSQLAQAQARAPVAPAPAPAPAPANPASRARAPMYLLPWQVTGIGTARRPDGAEYHDDHYCSAQVSEVATLAFQFTGALAGPNRSLTTGWLRECRRNRMGALYQVTELLFDSSAHALRPNASAVWAEAAEWLQPLVAAGSVIGAFMGDELLWGGIPYSDLVAAVNLVRRSFPRPFIIYANEALPVLQSDVNGHGHKVGYLRVPEEQDWLSIDYYSFRTGDDSANRSAESRYTRVLHEVYRANVYPKMSSRQSAVLVPGAYAPLWPAECQHFTGCPATRNQTCGRCCINPGYSWQNFTTADYDETMAKVAAEFWRWSQADEKVVGIAPWHYYVDDCAGPCGIGFDGLSKTRAAYAAMATQLRRRAADGGAAK